MFSNFHIETLDWLVPHSERNTDTHSLFGGQMFKNLPAASSKEWMLQPSKGNNFKCFKGFHLKANARIQP